MSANRNYFLFSLSDDAFRNMAYDEYFLTHLTPNDFLLLFYVNKNAVIIGKNQNAWGECNLAQMEQDDVQLARRVSGGGAVYHDSQNLNFSFIAGSTRYDVERQLKLIVDTMQALGIPAAFSGRNDILSDGKKFSGNAFCKMGNVEMHHGTLLIGTDLSRLQNYLNVSKAKIDSKGVKSVRARVCNLKEFNSALSVAAIADALTKVYKDTYGTYETPVFDAAQTQALETLYLKHASWDWRLGRTPLFDIQLETRFPWGGIELLLHVKKGIVEDCTVYTDALDPALSGNVASAVKGVRFAKHDLVNALAMANLGEAGADIAAFLSKQEF